MNSQHVIKNISKLNIINFYGFPMVRNVHSVESRIKLTRVLKSAFLYQPALFAHETEIKAQTAEIDYQFAP